VSDVRFDSLACLHLLWVVLALAGVVVYGFVQKQRALRRFASTDLFARLMPAVSRGKQRFKAALLLGAAVLMVASLIGPRWGVFWEDVQREGVDILVLLDVSKSMLAQDVVPNRLERAKQDIRDMLSILGGDQVGLMAFAGTASLKCPLTMDYGFLRQVLDEVEPASVARGGTAIGDAIRKAVGEPNPEDTGAFDDKIKKHKAIILITDGEDHETYPVEAARVAFEKHGVRIYTVGIGDSDQGQRVPVDEQGQQVYLKHDGQEVWSKMDPRTLREIALVSGGAYVPASTHSIELDKIYREKIAKLEKRTLESRKLKRYRPQYQWFLFGALVLLLWESLISERRRVAAGAGAMREAA
jgi:Ca-activated chloride channel family protein